MARYPGAEAVGRVAEDLADVAVPRIPGIRRLIVNDNTQ
jgi:hypothetical protein